jgi:triosephosphate isomerase
MNLSREEAVALAQGVVAQLGTTDVEVAVAPPSVYLDAVSQVTKGSAVGLSAQDMYHEANGAFTGEISASMLLDVGCRYVILGHSERRHILGETDEQVNRKVLAALAAGLVPIVCVGETLEEREADKTQSVVQRQCDGSLAGLSNEQMSGVVIAYEPVWAIGTGKVATPEQARGGPCRSSQITGNSLQFGRCGRRADSVWRQRQTG